MRPHGSAEELERRRRHGVALLQKGHGVREVARMVGVTPGAVVAWREQDEKKGDGGLAARPHPGRHAKLSPVQRKKLLRLVRKGPQAHGYPTDRWTLPRIADVIHKQFGHIVTDDFEMFVAVVRRRLRRPILLVMDRWSVHRAAAQRLLRRFSEQVQIEWLPAYAPELNPVEQVWNRTRYTGLASHIPDDLLALGRAVAGSIRHTRSQTALLRSFFRYAKPGL